MSEKNAWEPAPKALALGQREIHIWRVELEHAERHVADLARCLAAEEVARAAHFRFARDRRRYVVTRAVLRTLLGRVLSMAANDILLQYGPEGKPSLADEHGSDVQFNVAHSHELALVALSRRAALGVDVEHARELDDAPRIAQRFFSTQEVTALRATPAAQREAMFFRIWTRKEAFIKAIGKGLAQPLGAFSVMAADGNPLSHVQLEGAVTSWRLWDLFPGPNYGAALVVWTEREPLSLKQYQAGSQGV